MKGHGPLAATCHFLHRNFIWFLIGSYCVAALWPAAGLAMRGIHFGEVRLFQEKTSLSLPMLMLAALLLNAGLGVQTSQLRNLVQTPRFLAVGLAGNLLVPLTFIFVVSLIVQPWHEPVEVQQILVGLALIAAMPIAGSSTAWTQNANGDVALSLGLVLFSTLLSPLATPLFFHTVEQMASGEYAIALHDLESQGTGILLVFCVLLPSLLGIGLHYLLGADRIAAVKPGLKLVNLVNLLLLNYSNAAVSLPQTVADPDWDYLAVSLAIVATLCAVGFGAGFVLSKWLGANRGQAVSLMFGLGMNNNGTGLVLASMVLAAHPRVFLPVIFYNLVQHLAAGSVDYLLSRRQVEREGESAKSSKTQENPIAESSTADRGLPALVLPVQS